MRSSHSKLDILPIYIKLEDDSYLNDKRTLMVNIGEDCSEYVAADEGEANDAVEAGAEADDAICLLEAQGARIAAESIWKEMPQRQKLKELNIIIRENISTLKTEINQLSGFLNSYLNRTMLKVKSSEINALEALLQEKTFADMSIVAGIEKRHYLISCKNSTTENLLIRISEASSIDDFFLNRKVKLIFSNRK